jgi:transcriptional regulator with XRE-family HTH domain
VRFFAGKLTIVSILTGGGSMKMFSPERLSSKRRRMGKTQAVLSSETGISRVSISAIEKGKKEPRSSTLARLAGALGCEVGYFFVKC